MLYKLLIIVTLSTVFVIGCSIADKFIYHPNMNQGNYLSADEIIKIQKGMTQQQVIDTLGTPIIKDPFGQQIWYYISYQQFDGEKGLKQQILTLIFNYEGILTDIKQQTYYIKQQ